MKVAGALGFIFTIFVDSIVCPSRVADSLHGPGVPVFRVIEASAKELCGIFYNDESNPAAGNQPVLTHLDVVVRGNTVIGWEFDNHVRPIYDESGHMAKMEIQDHDIIQITIEEAVKLGVFSKIPQYAARHSRY